MDELNMDDLNLTAFAAAEPAGANENFGLDLSLFGEEGANLLDTEQLKEINKKLPKWSIEPPSKYKK